MRYRRRFWRPWDYLATMVRLLENYSLEIGGRPVLNRYGFKWAQNSFLRVMLPCRAASTQRVTAIVPVTLVPLPALTEIRTWLKPRELSDFYSIEDPG